MKPIFSALKRVRLLSDIPEMDSPPTATSPPSNSSRPERQFRSVVFPQPEGPMMATISPRGMLRSTPLKAWTVTPPVAYVFSRLRASTMASPANPDAVSSVASPNMVYALLHQFSLRQRVYGRSGRPGSEDRQEFHMMNVTDRGLLTARRRDG